MKAPNSSAACNPYSHLDIMGMVMTAGLTDADNRDIFDQTSAAVKRIVDDVLLHPTQRATAEALGAIGGNLLWHEYNQ